MSRTKPLLHAQTNSPFSTVHDSAADLDDFGVNLLLLLGSVKDDLLNGAGADQDQDQDLLLLPNAVCPVLSLFTSNQI